VKRGTPPGRLPFEIDAGFQNHWVGAVFRRIKSPLERGLGLARLNEIYLMARDLRAGDDNGFAETALNVLNVQIDVSDEDLARIPKSGPLVVVANHPFGGLEGIILTSLLTGARRDVKILANYILNRITEMRQHLIAVDPYGGREAAGKNLGPLREAIRWVSNGGALGVFPSGDVAHLSPTNLRVRDAAWNNSIARIIRNTGAQVLPVFFHGRNSLLFQLLGLVHPRVRTALLPRELVNKTGKRLKVRIGHPIAIRRLERFRTDRALSEYLRMRTQLLARRHVTVEPSGDRHAETVGDIAASGECAAPESVFEQEVARLTQDAELAVSGDLSVYLATAEQIPNLLNEIGRLRELTFREVGEGTGRDIDLDRFDDHYLHLFVWNRAKHELVGAYRLGLTDKILSVHGMGGLYTRTLYNYRRRLLDQISPAIELGRSFVRTEYQRDYAPLHLLWRGIGRFLVENPRHRMLFGPVSISSRYQTASMQLMVEFLKENNYASRLARLVKPKRPLKDKQTKKWARQVTRRLVGDIDEVSSLIADIEAQARGVPILLRHYLRLGGRLLAFNIDSHFSDVLDGLILVDLLDTPERILFRYLGKDGTREFLSYHEEFLAPQNAPVSEPV
jgi:putative hemolysin